MVSKDDYTPLLDAIKELPAMAIAYEKPDSKEVAAVLAKALGTEPEELQSEMEKMRNLMEVQALQLKDSLREMHELSQRHRKEMQRMQAQQGESEEEIAKLKLQKQTAEAEHRRLMAKTRDTYRENMEAARSSSLCSIL